MIPKEEMLPRPPSSVKLEDQILMAQVISPFVFSNFTFGVDLERIRRV